MRTWTIAEMEKYVPACQIDTLQLKTNGIRTNINKLGYVKMCYHTFDEKTGELHQTFKINPNTAAGHDIHTLTEYQEIMNDIMEELDPIEPKVNRVDVAFDFFDDNVYHELFKVNFLTALCLGEQFKIKNTYYSQSLMTLDDLTIRVQDSRLQTEYYNKKIAEPNGAINARYEIRSTRGITDMSISEILGQWFNKRFSAALTEDNVNKTLHKLNINLIKKYEIEKQEAPRTTIPKFLHEWRTRLFCVGQLAELYSMFRERGHTTKYSDAYRAANNTFYSERWESIEPCIVRQYINNLRVSAENYLKK